MSVKRKREKEKRKKEAAKCKHIIMDCSCFVCDAMQNKEMV